MGKNTTTETQNVERAKAFYERLDTLYAGLTGLYRDEFIMMVQDFNIHNMDSVLWQATNRWLRDHKSH